MITLIEVQIWNNKTGKKKMSIYFDDTNKFNNEIELNQFINKGLGFFKTEGYYLFANYKKDNINQKSIIS